MATTIDFNVDSSANANRTRSVTLSIQGYPASDGDGVQLTRLIGSPALSMLDPFLLLDMLYSDEQSDYLGGFPNHPHRGFETVTYVLAGRVRHEDNKGHTGAIAPGGVQWMTAGRGIIHSEMPEQEDGLLWGFQLWLNLPAAQKMTEPRYQEFAAHDIPVESRPDGSQVRVIAGQTTIGTTGPIRGVPTEPIYFDVTVAAGNEFVEPLPATHNSFIVVYDGSVLVHSDRPEQEQTVTAGMLAVLGEGNRVHISAKDTTGKFLLVAGKPLHEPVAHGGPFVMNTRAQVLQAYQDYWAGRF